MGSPFVSATYSFRDQALYEVELEYNGVVLASQPLRLR